MSKMPPLKRSLKIVLKLKANSLKILVDKNKNIDDYSSWPVWSCEVSAFDWEYSDEEHCFVIEGEVTVIGPENTVRIVPGDYVVFPKGMKCSWDVHKPIRKYYTFK